MHISAFDALANLLPAVFVREHDKRQIDLALLLTLLDRTYCNSSDFEHHNSQGYTLKWPGKLSAAIQSVERLDRMLKPELDLSRDWEHSRNVVISGDSLDALKLLQTSYAAAVKVILFDPYISMDDERRYLSPESYDLQTGVVESDSVAHDNHHAKWYSMVYARLLVARNLLKRDGSIFLLVIPQDMADLRKIADEVFGERSFVSDLVWDGSIGNGSVSQDHKFILMYAKDATNFVTGRLPRTDKANARYKNPDNDPRGPWVLSDLTAKTYSAKNDYPITTPSGRIVNPQKGGCWRYSKESLEKLTAEGRIYFGEGGNNVPRRKSFLSELKNEGMAATSFLYSQRVGSIQDAQQELRKAIDGDVELEQGMPLALIENLMAIANIKSGDLVLDLNATTGATAHAVLLANAKDSGQRRFILVQPNEAAPKNSLGITQMLDMSLMRLRRVGDHCTKVVRGV